MLLPALFTFLLTLTSCLVCYGVGLAVLKAFGLRTRNFFEMFFAEVIGLSLIVSAYALWMTKGQTVLALLPVFVLFAAWLCRGTPALAPPVAIIRPEEPMGHIKRLLVLLAGTIFLFAVRYVIATNAPDGQVTTVTRDYVYYSKTTYGLNIMGVEAQFINPLEGGYLSPQPYHYLDLWSNALLTRLTSIPAMQLLNTVVYTLMLVVLFIGFIAVYERFINRQAIIIPLALLSVFTCGTYFPLFSHVPFLNILELSYVNIIAIYPKILPIAIFLLLGFYLLLQERHVAVAWVWAALPMVYTVTAPAVCVGGSSLVLYLLMRRRIKLAEAALAVTAYVLVAVGIGLFYWLSAKGNPNGQSGVPSYAQYLPALNEWRTVVNNIIGTLLAQVIFHSPYFFIILLVLVLQRQSIKQFLRQNEILLVSVSLFALAAAAAGAVFVRAIDGYQLGINLMFAMKPAAVVLFLAIALQNAKPAPHYLAMGLLVVTLFYNLIVINTPPYNSASDYTQHDVNFVRQTAILEKQLSRYGGLLLDKSDYVSDYSFNSDISTYGMFIALIRDSTPLLSLSIADFDRPLTEKAFARDTAIAGVLIRNAPFTQFTRQQRQQGTFTSMAMAQEQFLIKNGINFVCTSPQAKLPATLQPLVKKMLIDPISRQKLYLLSIPLQEKSQPLPEQFVDLVW